MKQRKNKIRIFLNTIFLFLIAISGYSQLKDNIIAKVGNKEITTAEFKGRCEFTVRPNNYKDKSIALNNLIIEKVLAIEAEKDSLLKSNIAFQARIRGIKEQTMREKLYEKTAYGKAKVDTTTIKRIYRLSIREYELEFYRIPKSLAQKVNKQLDSIPTDTDKIFNELSTITGKKPVHKIKYTDPDDYAIHDVIYSKPLNIGEVIRPIQLATGEYIIMKVINWTTQPLITETEQQERWDKVVEKERKKLAAKIWHLYSKEIMRGKKIDFNNDIFYKLANWVRAKYINEQEKSIKTKEQIPEIPLIGDEIDLNAPFFKFDNRIWTVSDFRNELMSRPFLFRTIDPDSANFNEQLRIAIADIMKDRILTQEAYKQSLEKTEDIKRTVAMWKDAYLANDQQKNVVNKALKEEKINKGDELGILAYWESYLNNLQTKYKHSISINESVYKSISLTKIDMYAIKFGMPYPSVAPDFPTFSASNNYFFQNRKIN